MDTLDVREGGARVGLVKWSDTSKVEFHLNRYVDKQDVIQHVRHVMFVGGRTHTSSALRTIKDEMFTSRNGDRGSVQNLLIILTDGNSNVNPELTVPDAIDARVKGIQVIVVSIGTDLNMLELRGIASQPHVSNLFPVDGYRDLAGISSRVIRATCDGK